MKRINSDIKNRGMINDWEQTTFYLLPSRFSNRALERNMFLSLFNGTVVRLGHILRNSWRLLRLWCAVLLLKNNKHTHLYLFFIEFYVHKNTLLGRKQYYSSFLIFFNWWSLNQRCCIWVYLQIHSYYFFSLL